MMRSRSTHVETEAANARQSEGRRAHHTHTPRGQLPKSSPSSLRPWPSGRVSIDRMQACRD